MRKIENSLAEANLWLEMSGAKSDERFASVSIGSPATKPLGAREHG